MSFFKQFPKETYSIETDGISTDIVDIFRYVDVVEKASQNVLAYKYVDAFDGERPDNLSQRLYGTPDYYWTFFLTNDFLKDGLTAWPKGDSEVRNFVDNQHKDLAALRFPVMRYGADDIRTLAGLPLMDDNYKQYLKVYHLFDTSFIDNQLVQIYATAKLVDYKPNLSQIWIDTSTIAWSSDYGPFMEQIGDGGALDTEYTRRAQSLIYPAGETSDSYHVRFVNPYTPDDVRYASVQDLENKFTQDVKDIAIDLRPSQNFQSKGSDDIQRAYNLTCTQSWKVGKTAPAHYYNPVSINDEITEYASGPEATNYITREQDVMDQNDVVRRIQYVSPQYIQTFAQEYKRLLNE
tara:strand:- start:2526 stop:3575 length:1050 start_codon:yes stop_codon:yes gene_type:complete